MAGCTAAQEATHEPEAAQPTATPADVPPEVTAEGGDKPEAVQPTATEPQTTQPVTTERAPTSAPSTTDPFERYPEPDAMVEIFEVYPDPTAWQEAAWDLAAKIDRLLLASFNSGDELRAPNYSVGHLTALGFEAMRKLADADTLSTRLQQLADQPDADSGEIERMQHAIDVVTDDQAALLTDIQHHLVTGQRSGQTQADQ